MKKKYSLLSLFCLIGTLIIAVQAKSSSTFTGNVFALAYGTNPYIPLNYTPAPGFSPSASCPGSGKVCHIDVNNSDIYIIADAPAPSYVGKPKVDISTGATGELSDDIAAALATAGESTTPVNGRIIYETN